MKQYQLVAVTERKGTNNMGYPMWEQLEKEVLAEADTLDILMGNDAVRQIYATPSTLPGFVNWEEDVIEGVESKQGAYTISHRELPDGTTLTIKAFRTKGSN